jgi:hypothetical protein
MPLVSLAKLLGVPHLLTYSHSPSTTLW